MHQSRKPLVRLLKNPGGAFGAGVVVLLVVVALAAPLLAPYDPNRPNPRAVLQGPSHEHLFGTDALGRDLLSRVIHGSRVSLAIGVLVVLISGVVGVLLGVFSAVIGGALDVVVQSVGDFMLALPTLLLALVIITILGPGLWPAMIAVGISRIPNFIRIARSSAMAIRGLEFVEASRALGQTRAMIVLRHVLPNCIGPLIVQATLLIASTILIAASLGFLGLGVQPPNAEWGNLVSSGRNYLRSAPHVFLFPSAALALAILGFNLLGDAMRDALDVRQ